MYQFFQDPKTTIKFIIHNEVAEKLSDTRYQQDLAPINSNDSHHSPASKQNLSAWAQGSSETQMAPCKWLLRLPYRLLVQNPPWPRRGIQAQYIGKGLQGDENAENLSQEEIQIAQPV